MPLSLAACAGGRGTDGAVSVAETICTGPRPEICTLDYRPVCARLESGERRSYSNACGACADPVAMAFIPGACE